MKLLAQMLFVGALLSLGGGLVFEAVVTPRALAHVPPDRLPALRAALGRWLAGCLAACCLGLVAWVALQTVDFAGSMRAVRLVLTRTSFGQVAIVQAALLAATGVLLGCRRRAGAAAPALACVAAQAAHGHGMAIGGVFGPLFELDMLHLVAASIWLGALPPLLLLTALTPPRAGAAAARRFSPVGKWAVGLLAVSAAAQACGLVGSWPALPGSAYGRVVLVKCALFSVLLAFALLNRYRLGPRLLGPTPEPARRHLLASVAWQSLAGLMTIVAACLLASLAPPAERG